ncbi:hypothetical protein AGMMS50229_19700 [Campylobacterota bacterium]|nr:hypothetical protein AGMMS50229_19700 [Campylobacterota bacterium]
MKLDKLQYQLDAIEKAVAAIDKSDITENANFYANPILQRTRNIDIKMETGTGKTYVYTRLMHQLRQTLGFFKFIIMVPSVAIKEGVKMSIQSDDWNKHFRLEFGNQSISLGAINAGDFSSKKGKRKQIPEALRSFCDSSRAEEKMLSVLLLNDAMLASSSMSSNDYDSTLFGSIGCPLEGLEATRPIVIIDEPHRFRKEGKAWENINKLSPQLIIRFGATFPEIENSKGKLKTKKIDYENLVYDLNSVRAFNEGLVKGVHIQYPAVVSDDDNMIKCKVKSINKNGNKLRSVTFSINNRDTEVPFGGNLSAVDENFGDITLELDGKNIVLSSGTMIEAGMLILPQIYSMSYQEILLKQALDIHFEKEEQNFFRPNNAPKIKTNSLFFIDSISSFRGDNKTGWLRAKFEDLLQIKINLVLAKIAGQTRYDEYGDFLRYSLQNIKKCLAGYFAQDNGDRSVQEEIDLVLRDKEQSLRFRNKNGEWNVCRFFFSKWTLCEGWDNPNVFVITKLRSSGSENRKIQEVGRGLRLPFDESGRRIADEKFYLSYIIDYSERAFAKKLVGEINNDGGLAMDNIITEELIDILVASGYATAAIPAQMKLLSDGIINENRELLDAEKLRELLPESERDRISKAGNVLSEGAPQQPKIKLNRDNFEKLRPLGSDCR